MSKIFIDSNPSVLRRSMILYPSIDDVSNPERRPMYYDGNADFIALVVIARKGNIHITVRENRISSIANTRKAWYEEDLRRKIATYSLTGKKFLYDFDKRKFVYIFNPIGAPSTFGFIPWIPYGKKQEEAILCIVGDKIYYFNKMSYIVSALDMAWNSRQLLIPRNYDGFGTILTQKLFSLFGTVPSVPEEYLEELLVPEKTLKDLDYDTTTLETMGLLFFKESLGDGYDAELEIEEGDVAGDTDMILSLTSYAANQEVFVNISSAWVTVDVPDLTTMIEHARIEKGKPILYCKSPESFNRKLFEDLTNIVDYEVAPSI